MKKVFLGALLLVPVLFPATSWGAELVFDVGAQPAVGDTFPVAVSVNTELESINAIEGSILFSSSVELVAVRHEGSVVPLWVTPPREGGQGVVHFAAVIPGGYRGVATGNLFTLVLRARTAGTARLSFGRADSYLNDGKGSAARTRAADVTLQIAPVAGDAQTFLVSDTTPPEPFTLTLVPAGEVGGTESVLVWNPVDKGAGVRESLVCIGFRRCVVAASPYALHDADTRQLIRVQVVDGEGNAAHAYLFTLRALWWHLGISFATILAGVVCFVLFRAWRRSP